MRSNSRRWGLVAACLPFVACGGSPLAAGTAAATAPVPTTTVAPTSEPKDPHAELAARIDPLFAEAMRPGAPGCAVGVYRAGEVVFAKGYGLASLELAAPITDRTVFSIESVSKQFTATAILLLVQDGKVSLDDDVRKYVPSVPSYPAGVITLRHLLNHTSGLRDYTVALALAGVDDADVTNGDDQLWSITHQRGLNFAPGAQFSYSNTNYFLLSLVVRRVTGKTLAAFVKERIFAPLGMNDSLIRDDHTLVIAREATPYAVQDDGSYAVAAENYEGGGDAGVHTTVLDLARWDANFYEPIVGGAAWLGAMRTRARLRDGTELPYTMGLERAVVHGREVEEHDGVNAGFRAMIARFPAERLAVAVLCNRTDALPSRALRVAEALLGVPAGADAGMLAASPSREALSAMVGTYLDRDAGDMSVRTIRLDGDALQMGFTISGGMARRIDTTDGRHLTVRGGDAGYGDARYELVPAAGKALAHLLRVTVAGVHDRMPETFVRFEPGTPPSPSSLAEYAGRYTSSEATRDITIAAGSGSLHFGPWARSPWSVPVEWIERDTFSLGGFMALHFERDARGAVRGLTTTHNRARGVSWNRRAE